MPIPNRPYRGVEGEYHNAWKSEPAHEADVQKGIDKMERQRVTIAVTGSGGISLLTRLFLLL